jgi:cyclopropane-fatty-acyl-phospholipid synthase
MNDAALPLAFPNAVRRRDRLAARLVLSRLARWRGAPLTMVLPEGSEIPLGGENVGAPITIRIDDWRFFWRALTSADIGVGESYMDGEWRTDDLVGVCRGFLSDPAALDYDSSTWTIGDRLLNVWRRLSSLNTISGSRRNIRHHYDLSNDLFRLFLDDTMLYSCAVYRREDASLGEAQLEKVDGICRALGFRPGHEVLEIGGGWGAFAIHAAQRYGCRVTSLTLSEEQLRLARERVAAAGLEDRVEIRLCDYREANDAFDRIVSIEMFEAVGYEYFGTFFQTCARCLRPGGRMLLQTISVPDQRFERYRRSFDWIRKYVFPGGLLPSLHEITRAVKEHSSLRIHRVEDIGLHYARTLRHWRDRFLTRLPEVRRLGFDDRFIRMWEFYLASCEAAFAVRYVSDLQIELEQPV